MTETPAQLEHILDELDSLDLESLGQVRLMDREDTKFVFHEDQLPEVIHGLANRFRVLEIDRRRQFLYRTRYLDTPDLRFYLDHHNGLRPRIKIRYRQYENPAATYFEVKVKGNRNRTRKMRMPAREMGDTPGPDETTFLQEHLPTVPATLSRSLDVRFQRFTLVNRHEPDRITVDTDLEVLHGDHWQKFPDLVIAEIKQPRYRPSSRFIQTMRKISIHEMRLSKYCLGILMTHRGIRYNRFKPKLMRLNTLLDTQQYTEVLYA